jgi:hypothetical protein
MRLLTDVLASLRRLLGPSKSSDVRPGNVYSSLRRLALAMLRAQLDTSLTPELPVYGVLMEFGFSAGPSTLFALADGHTSLYGSGGGGNLGGGLHENVTESIGPLMETANRCLSRMNPIDSFPVPQAEHTTFYVLTDSGVFASDCRTDELADDSHALSILYHAGHEVLTQLRYSNWRSPAIAMLIEKDSTTKLPPERRACGVLREVGQPSANTHALLAMADGRAGVYSLLGAALIYPRELPENLAKAKEIGSYAGIAVSGEVRENLSQANARFVETADRLLGHMQPTELFPVPVEGQTTFYVVTRAGVFFGSGLTEDLVADRHPLSPLYRAAEDVNEQGRLASQAGKTGLGLG